MTPPHPAPPAPGTVQVMPPAPAVLIHNPGAGTSHRADPAQLRAALRDAGFDAEYRPTRTPHDLGPALSGPLPGPHGMVWIVSLRARRCESRWF